MKIRSRLLLGLLLVLSLVGSCYSISWADPITNPTHFDDTYWYWPSDPSGYTQMDTDITPVVDGSPDGYYFSAYYWFAGDYPATGGYLGLQTNGDQPTGKIAIFSLWGATSSTGPGYNGSGTEAGEEYYTSRISYAWTVNTTYDLRIYLVSNASGSETWRGSVINESTGVQSWIGNIVVPSHRGNLYDISSTFHERYSGATASCTDMHESEVKFTNLTANGGPIQTSSHENVQPTGSACSGYFATENIAGGIETIIGGQFPAPSPSPSPVITKTTAPTTEPSPSPASSTSPTTMSSSTPKATSPVVSEKPGSINVKVVNSDNQLINKAKVTLDNKTTKYTDVQGTATFFNVASGKHTIEISYSNKKLSEQVSLTPGQYKLASYTVPVQGADNPAAVVILLLVLVAIAADIVLIIKNKAYTMIKLPLYK